MSKSTSAIKTLSNLDRVFPNTNNKIANMRQSKTNYDPNKNLVCLLKEIATNANKWQDLVETSKRPNNLNDKIAHLNAIQLSFDFVNTFPHELLKIDGFCVCCYNKAKELLDTISLKIEMERDAVYLASFYKLRDALNTTIAIIDKHYSKIIQSTPKKKRTMLYDTECDYHSDSDYDYDSSSDYEEPMPNRKVINKKVINMKTDNKRDIIRRFL